MKNLWYNFNVRGGLHGEESQAEQMVEYCFGLSGDPRTVRELKSKVFDVLTPVDHFKALSNNMGG